jgi:hypothetical protein
MAGAVANAIGARSSSPRLAIRRFRAQASGHPELPRQRWLRRRAIVPYWMYGRQGTDAVRAMSVTHLGGGAASSHLCYPCSKRPA